ncbi:zinc finger protein 347-like [Chrysoperla carnea]|uniref:zinc finger protein 347-like n=1 Tax=Chrysoperla carnea TaxID=189513 RepID=UPI001D087AAC|nr:zinc finger protein 347-like [Chrysoperla carnea]
MRHRESEVPSEEIKAEVKNEYNLDIKDEDFEAFGLGISLDVPLVNGYEKQPNLTTEFCDNEDSLLDESVFVPSSPRNSPVFRRRRKALQPQRAKQNNIFPLATFPRNNYNFEEDSNNFVEEAFSDDSQNEFKDIEQELEEEMVSNDDDENNSTNCNDRIVINQNSISPGSPDLDSSQFSNDIDYNNIDDEELEDIHTSPPDMDSDHFFKGLREDAVGDNEELDEKTKKTVEEEWRAHWGVKCNVCSEVFAEKHEFDEHYGSAYSLRPVYTCCYCDKTMNTYSTFRSHCYRHIAEGRYKCSHCSKGFSLRSILHLHILARHTDIKPFTCDECQKGFVTRAGLNIHLRKHRQNQKEDFPCGECGKTLHTRGGLTAHMNVHKLGRRFMCDICGKTFTQKVNMQQHVKQHTGERPFTCDQCGKSFAEKSHLARHHSFHSEQRPFECNVCKKMYKTERCLKVHRLVHAVSRPHVCSYCNKGFLSSTKLKQHHNIHTGERPYKCKYCERTFTNYPNWLKHIRRRHKVDHKTGLCLVPTPKQEDVKPSPTPTPGSDHPVQSHHHHSQSEPELDLDLELDQNQLEQATTIDTDTTVIDSTEMNSNSLMMESLESHAAVSQQLINDPLLLDYSKLTTDHNNLLTTAAAAAIQLNEDSKMNMQTHLFPQYELVANTSYATNMTFMLPFQQNNISLLEPHPAHQNQFILQATHHNLNLNLNPEEPHPAHQQQMLFPDHMHFLHTQHMLQM